MKDLLVQSRFKNNILFEALAGRTLLEVSEASGVPYSTLCGFINLSTSPRKRNGNFNTNALSLSSFFNIPEEELFPLTLYNLALPRTIERRFSSEEIYKQLGSKEAFLLSTTGPEEEMTKRDQKKILKEVLNTLKPREKKVIILRYGLNGPAMNLAQVAQHFAIGTERVRQIEATALRRLKHPLRSNALKQCTDIGAIDSDHGD